MAHYGRFYSGDPIRLTANLYAEYDKAPLFEIIEQALGHREQESTIPPDNLGATILY